MIINPLIIKFLEIIDNKDLSFTPINECDLKKEFKQNQYYQLKKFCIDNKLININYHIITLSMDGKYIFNSLKTLKVFKN
jgi:hypothetical protein